MKTLRLTWNVTCEMLRVLKKAQERESRRAMCPDIALRRKVSMQQRKNTMLEIKFKLLMGRLIVFLVLWKS